MVWSNREVQELAKNYVAVADELHNLRTGETSEAKFFQAVFKQKQKHPGHQGVFLATPSGRLLASSTCYEASKVVQLLEDGLAAWRKLTTAERLEPRSKLIDANTSGRPEDLYPIDGLVLRVTARDLPESNLSSEPNARWHRYFLWFSRDELESFLPTRFVQGQTIDFPQTLANRVVCLSLLDKGEVDGFTKPFLEKDVDQAQVRLTVVDISATEVRFEITGTTAARAKDAQAFMYNLPRYKTIPEYRGVQSKLLGSATWNKNSQRFTGFQMLAVGTRFGGAYVGRKPDDWGEHPIGFSFVLGNSSQAEQIAPEFPDRYPWLNKAEVLNAYEPEP